jgi:ribosomal protein S18 acetylase RimI-like enzyme
VAWVTDLNLTAPGATRDVSWVIRPARDTEIDAVLAMFEWLFEPPGYAPRWWDEGRARSALAEAIEARTSAVLVAEAQAGELVGLISAYLDLNSIRFGPRCWIEDLAVDPTHRSAGIGRALLEAAKAWASEHGATHLELDTALAREDAQRFYEQQQPIAKGYTYSWAL